MNFEKYIGEEVIIKCDGSDDLTNGKLVRIIPRESGEEGETLVVDCNGVEKKFPIIDLLQFFSKNELDNEDTEYYYVIFRYGKTERSKEHIYMSYDYSVKAGDKILVWKDWLYVGNVIRTGFFKKSEAPYPVEKTWFIQHKVYDRIDFMKYQNSKITITSDNLYKDNYLNTDNDYRQYVAKVDYQYRWLAEGNTDFLEKRKPKEMNSDSMTDYIIQMTKEELTDYQAEYNQMDVFYESLWICSYIAKYNGYDKYLFDRYICMSLIYKHGDFDEFLLAPAYDKPNIDKEIRFLDDYISKINIHTK
ncbi:MAG: hypothetical protein IKT56_00990 [Clostridia bacterium]|nr:hypothetical protein [Clostridia bacterium]